jgi:glucose-6-phosphate 1-dehydrogenase
MVEKPFGRDLKSAIALDSLMLRHFAETQVYRIDHYLGKNTVQNILVFRFSNTIFEPVWNAGYIDSVKITVAEGIGIEQRAGYFEQAGMIRDMLQNHMLQLLAIIAMEQPATFDAAAVRDEKTRTIKAIRHFNLNKLDDSIIRGQYMSGGINMPGYREEPGVYKNSCVETFFAAKLFVDNKRWKGVPFYLRAGKRLAAKATKITVLFKNRPDCLFCKLGIEHQPNSLTFSIQPEQGVALKFMAKVPGAKLCLSPLDMDFNYRDLFGADSGGDYETIILDCMLGDQTLFWRKDGIEEAWRLLTPVLEKWDVCPVSEKNSMLHFYKAGTWGPEEADAFIKRDKREWID